LKIDILKIEILSYKPVKLQNFYVAVYQIYEGNVCKKELFYFKIFTVDALETYFNEDQCSKQPFHNLFHTVLLKGAAEFTFSACHAMSACGV
jgi:hypothetical protein